MDVSPTYRVQNEEYQKYLRSRGLEAASSTVDKLSTEEPMLRRADPKYKYVEYFKSDYNIDTNGFTHKLMESAQSKYGVTALTDCEVKSFIFKHGTKECVGVLTDRGVINCDLIVIAAGLETKHICGRLGRFVPITPLKGYSITPKKAKDPQTGELLSLKYNVTADDKKLFCTNFYDDRYRIAGFAELRGEDLNIYEDRIKLLIEKSKGLIGDFPTDDLRPWTGLRPLTPDDGPIIGNLTDFPNVYVNCGHGSKGMILSLGAARLLTDSLLGRQTKDMDIANYALRRFELS
jgi:D-amino-acid dehydrogenase